MKRASLLKEELAERTESQSAIMATMKTEKRDLNDTEAAEFRQLSDDINKLNVDIRTAEAIELAEERAAKANKGTKQVKKDDANMADFSFSRMVQNIVDRKPHTGAEKAILDMGEAMDKEAGRKTTGMSIPVAALTRAISVVAGNGEKWVEDLDGGFIEALRDRMVLPGLGARTMGNLTGDIFLPRLVGGSASWNAETGSIADSAQDTESVTMSPKRVGATSTVSLQFLNQSSVDADALLTSDLLDAIALKVDYAGISGGGTNEPNGILATSGIGDVAIGTNGGAVTFDHILQLEEKVAVGNAAKGALNYLTNPVVRRVLKGEATDAGSGQFVWMNNDVNGYPAEISNGVPSAGTKGTGTALSSMIYGNFNDVVIGQWGTLNVIVDPFTLAGDGQVKITVQGFFDVAVRQPKSFAAILDITTA